MSNPSSTQRSAKLRTLAIEFTRRDIGRVGVADLLDCSASAARYYLAELQDAGLVSLVPARQTAVFADRKLYRLIADRATVDAFLDRMAEPAPNFSSAAGRAPTRRDPLVAALFGTPDAARF